jgi:small-conductance mechanosensitive channel
MIKLRDLSNTLFYFSIILLFLYGYTIDNVSAQEDSGENTADNPASSDHQTSPSSPNSTPTFFNSWWIDLILISAITIVISIIIFLILKYFLNRFARTLNLDKGELKGILSISKMIIIVVAIIIIIFQFSNVSGFVASAVSVAIGTIIGFSSRNTISNAIAGILLLSSRPFSIGDRIHTTEENQLIGDVMEIALLYTKIKTIRNELVVIPNQILLQRQIINYSGLEYLAASVKISLTYDIDRVKAEFLLIEAAKNTNGISIDKEVPFVLITELNTLGVVYELRAFTNKTNEFLKIQSDLRKNIFDIFYENKINMTVPNIEHQF